MSGLTKIFIVLQLVFSLVVSVLLVLMVSKQEPYKNLADAQRTDNIALAASNSSLQTNNAALTAAVSDKEKALEEANAQFATKSATMIAQLADLQRKDLAGDAERATNKTQITSLSNTLESLKGILAEKDKVVETIRPQLTTLLTQNSELGRVNNDLQNQLRSAELAVRKLQESLVNMDTSKPGAVAPGAESGAQVASLSATNQTAVEINGKITGVDQSAGRILIQTGLGSRDNVKVSTRFSIYRDNKFIADAVVTRVTPDQSVATIQSSKQGETVQVGDLVTSGGK